MALSEQLFYLGSEKIVEAGGTPRFKLTSHVFDDEDAGILYWNHEYELFYAHDPDLGFLVVRSKYGEDNKYWHDGLNERKTPLDKPTEKIRRINIVKRVRENPGGTLDSADRNFEVGNTVHYVTTEEMVEGSPKSFYILYTNQIEELMFDRGITWKREIDRERLRRGGFEHLTDPDFEKEMDAISGRITGGTGDNGEIEINRTDIEIAEISKDIYSFIDLKYLLVRYGVNELLEQDRPEEEKEKMILRNEVFSVDSNYLEQSEKLEVGIPFRFYRSFPTEFKMFADVLEPGRLVEVMEEFDSSPSCKSASVSDSVEDRVYFLLDEFRVTETPEGFRNNVAYPE